MLALRAVASAVVGGSSCRKLEKEWALAGRS